MARDFGFLPTENDKYYFISYNSEDAERIAPIARGLHQVGVPVWYDRGLIYGKEWDEQISVQIGRAEAVILFFTRGILNKPKSYVKREYRIATDLFGKTIYVVMMDDIKSQEIPMTMASWWSEIQDQHNIIAIDSTRAAVDAVLQAIGSGKRAEQIAKQPRERMGGLSLFDMLGIRNIDEFDIEKHWQAADVTQSLAVPIGVLENGEVVSIDLHQRKDGPNGIIAGAAGTGKTEFLYTAMLCLALHYSPEQIQLHFVSPFGLDALRALPHVGVSVRALNDSQAEYDALQEYFAQEAARREQLLSKHQVLNAYQYLKKRKTDPSLPPMPHIVLLIDSYEWLKRDEPWQVVQLLEWGKGEKARRYGMHLIIATQSPMGVVDDALEVMTQFKIFTGAKDEAPDLCHPGRMYLQTQAHDSLRLLQLAYSSEGAAKEVEKNRRQYEYFFREKTQLQTIIQAIERCCLD